MINDGRLDNEADDGTVSYTIRNIPVYLDNIITSQAASAGKPKATWLRELLVDSFRDDISNFIRKSGLVASLDAELLEYLRASADPNGYSGLQPGINEGYINFLNLKCDDDLKHILLIMRLTCEIWQEWAWPGSTISGEDCRLSWPCLQSWPLGMRRLSGGLGKGFLLTSA